MPQNAYIVNFQIILFATRGELKKSKISRLVREYIRLSSFYRIDLRSLLSYLSVFFERHKKSEAWTEKLVAYDFEPFSSQATLWVS